MGTVSVEKIEHLVVEKCLQTRTIPLSFSLAWTFTLSLSASQPLSLEVAALR